MQKITATAPEALERDRDRRPHRQAWTVVPRTHHREHLAVLRPTRRSQGAGGRPDGDGWRNPRALGQKCFGSIHFWLSPGPLKASLLSLLGFNCVAGWPTWQMACWMGMVN